MMRNDQGGWLIPTDLLSKFHIRSPIQSQLLVEDGIAYAPLALMKVVSLTFDEPTQSIDIVFDVSVFESNQLVFQPKYQSGNLQAPEGLFVNYDLSLTRGSSFHSESIFSEFGIAVGKGIALLNVAGVGNDESHRFMRLETSYTQDSPSDMTVLRVGDSITRPATSLGRPLRFGGIQLATDFRMRPGMVTMPVPTLSGQAALPSTAEIYVNNVLQNSTALPPGPFSITTAPIVTGDGEVLLRVRDIAGREELVSGRFYSSAALLAPGLSDYSVEVGKLRRNYALPDDHYEKPFVSGAYRRGISNTLTLEVGSSLAAGGLGELLGSGAVAFPGVGVASLAVGMSHDQDGSGTNFAVSFERRSRQASFALRSERADSSYRQLGVDPVFRLRALDTAFASYRFEEMGTLGLSYTRQQRMLGEALEIISASFSTPASRLGSVIISVLQSRGTENNYAMSVFWSIPIGGDISASLSHISHQRSSDTTVLQAQKNSPYGEGIGWRLQAAANAAQQAAVLAQNAYGAVTAEAASFRGESSARIGVSGALVRMNERWFPTRRIAGSYGLVHLPGVQNARVYVDNQFSTRTDSDGYALLPRLRPYVLNHVSLEQSDLPMDMRIDQLIAQPVPGWRSGVVINFAVKKIRAATLRVVDRKGNDIPAGASVRLRGVETSFAVGRDGITYVEGLATENTIEIIWSDRRCEVSIPYLPSEEIVPYLGEFVCQEQSK
jgi:outer membrane usher protein